MSLNSKLPALCCQDKIQRKTLTKIRILVMIPELEHLKRTEIDLEK